MSAITQFDQYGNFSGTISAECVTDCTQPGQDASEPVKHWITKLDFTVPRDMAIRYLKDFGAWPVETDEYDQGLEDMSDGELAEKVLWIACGDIEENREWFGLIH